MRAIIMLLALYGLRTSRIASSNIHDVQEEAEAGDRRARQHFTQTRYARLFGPLNSDLGNAYYAIVAFCAITGLIRQRIVLTALRLASASTVVVSLYLLWALFFRLRVRCPICIRGHMVNGAIFIALLRKHE